MEPRRLVVWIAAGILGFQGGTLALDLLNCTVLSWIYVRRYGLERAVPSASLEQRPPTGLGGSDEMRTPRPQTRPLLQRTSRRRRRALARCPWIPQRSSATGPETGSMKPSAKGSASWRAWPWGDRRVEEGKQALREEGRINPPSLLMQSHLWQES